ncbi:TPA: DsbA family protein [Escherichia coli]
MYKKILCLLLSLVISGGGVAQDYSAYSVLARSVTSTVKDNETVIEFFSFYCPPCYAFSKSYGIDKAVREILPPGKKMMKYHAGFLGPLGDELTRAWSVAMLMGIEEKVEPLLFDAVQNTKMLKTTDDIRDIFIRAGMTAVEYDMMLVSQEVSDMTERQKRLFDEFGVSGTPSVFVNGKYHIDNSAIEATSVEMFRERYVSIVKMLLNKDNAPK